MATIQIREVPEETYEVIRRRARNEGQSIQAYMRHRVIEMAERPTKAEIAETIEKALSVHGPAGAAPEDIVADVAAGRR